MVYLCLEIGDLCLEVDDLCLKCLYDLSLFGHRLILIRCRGYVADRETFAPDFRCIFKDRIRFSQDFGSIALDPINRVPYGF